MPGNIKRNYLGADIKEQEFGVQVSGEKIQRMQGDTCPGLAFQIISPPTVHLVAIPLIRFNGVSPVILSQYPLESGPMSVGIQHSVCERGLWRWST